MDASDQWRRAVASTDTPENRLAHAMRLLEKIDRNVKPPTKLEFHLYGNPHEEEPA
jgi:hypothetical protein